MLMDNKEADYHSIKHQNKGTLIKTQQLVLRVNVIITIYDLFNYQVDGGSALQAQPYKLHRLSIKKHDFHAEVLLYKHCFIYPCVLIVLNAKGPFLYLVSFGPRLLSFWWFMVSFVYFCVYFLDTTFNFKNLLLVLDFFFLEGWWAMWIASRRIDLKNGWSSAEYELCLLPSKLMWLILGCEPKQNLNQPYLHRIHEVNLTGWYYHVFWF